MTDVETAGPGTTHDIGRTVRAALTEVLERDVADVHDDVALFDELGLDSTGVLDLLMSLEEQLSIEFDTDGLEMSDFMTVGTLQQFVERQSAG